MARSDQNEPVLLSVLDRLLDDEPETSSEAPRNARQTMRELKAAVRRDLENLLNTRQRWRGWPRGLDQLERSLLNYGVPDLTGASLASSRAREEFLRSLEAVIRRCEPRFKTVKVVFAADKESVDRSLRFRIEALLHADPVPESVVFDSRLEPVTRMFELEA
jgi:type VI secretion system protein ImpF